MSNIFPALYLPPILLYIEIPQLYFFAFSMLVCITVGLFLFVLFIPLFMTRCLLFWLKCRLIALIRNERVSGSGGDGLVAGMELTDLFFISFMYLLV